MLGRNKRIASNTWIYTPYILVIPCIRLFVITVHKDHPRFRGLPGRLADQVPQTTSADCLLYLTLPDEIPVRILFYRFHELIGDANREIGMFDLASRALDCNELFYIGMRVIQHDHKRASSTVRSI